MRDSSLLLTKTGYYHAPALATQFDKSLYIGTHILTVPSYDFGKNGWGSNIRSNFYNFIR